MVMLPDDLTGLAIHQMIGTVVRAGDDRQPPPHRLQPPVLHPGRRHNVNVQIAMQQ